MSNKGDLYLEKDGPIATLYFNRPEKRNAISHEMWKAIPGLVHEVEEDSSIKVLILRGVDHTAFAAGADISEFYSIMSSVEGAKLHNETTHIAERALVSLTKPSIAMIQGFCIGGGCELAVACDFRFSDTNGRFGITPAKLGLVYSLEATKQLVDLVGPQNAKFILYSGKHFDIERAVRMGLVDEVYSPGEIEQKTYEFAKLLTENAQFPIRVAKYFVAQILQGVNEETEEARNLRLGSFETSDYQEGVRAFMEKRKPQFTGNGHE
ncbi:MAG TPA: enoyl-CoA hydratase-related protein [Bacillota bacterium]|nr:enoyl-CoA hydratase-related protein [Bacillota bacterium]